jgi:hypothetical protein
MKTKRLFIIVCLIIATSQLVFCDMSFAQSYDTAIQKYLLVKTWKGTINIHYSGTSGEYTYNNSSLSNVVLTNEMGGMVMMWPYPDVTKRNRTDYSLYEINSTDCIYSIRATGQMDYGVLLGINIINKAYYIHCIWEQIMGNFNGCDYDPPVQLTQFHPNMADIEEYPIDLSLVTPVLKGNKTYTDIDGITVTAEWDLIPETGRSQVTIDPIDENWLPENNSVISTKIKWDAEDIPTQVKFTLYDVSKEPGTCLNSIEKDKSPDLVFDSVWVNENHYEITQKSETEFVAQRTSLELTNELTVSIKCFDYGASAKLKAEILINNEWKTAVAKNGTENFISIPFDKDNDKIADKWEYDNEVNGLAPDSDMDKYPTSNEIGDAITLYEEYRGFFVLDPDKKHIRTNPNKRELFVIDMDELFSVPAWENASDIMAYRLNNSMVKGGDDGQESRIVDFNQKYSAGVHKYAIRLKNSSGTAGDEGKVTLGECFPETSSRVPPKYWDSTVIYVEAINYFSDRAIRKLERENNQTDDRLREVTGLTREQFNRLHEIIRNTSVVSTIKEFFVNRTVLHEVGHSCAVDHHDPVESGFLSCPMKYGDDMDDFTYIKDFLMEILEFISGSGEGETIISFGNSKLCVQFNCYNEVKVRDD